MQIAHANPNSGEISPVYRKVISLYKEQDSAEVFHSTTAVKPP